MIIGYTAILLVNKLHNKVPFFYDPIATTHYKKHIGTPDSFRYLVGCGRVFCTFSSNKCLLKSTCNN